LIVIFVNQFRFSRWPLVSEVPMPVPVPNDYESTIIDLVKAASLDCHKMLGYSKKLAGNFWWPL